MGAARERPDALTPPAANQQRPRAKCPAAVCEREWRSRIYFEQCFGGERRLAGCPSPRSEWQVVFASVPPGWCAYSPGSIGPEDHPPFPPNEGRLDDFSRLCMRSCFGPSTFGGRCKYLRPPDVGKVESERKVDFPFPALKGDAFAVWIIATDDWAAVVQECELSAHQTAPIARVREEVRWFEVALKSAVSAEDSTGKDAQQAIVPHT